MTLDIETIRQRRKQLNESQFPSEVWFEKQLCNRRIKGFRRNMCLESVFFGDFVWRKKKLVIEIDGSSHKGKEDYDNKRDKFLRSRGWTVVRIKFPSSKESLDKFFLDWAPQLNRGGPDTPKKKAKRKKKIKYVCNKQSRGKTVLRKRKKEKRNQTKHMPSTNFHWKGMKMTPGFVIRRNGIEIKKVTLDKPIMGVIKSKADENIRP